MLKGLKGISFTIMYMLGVFVTGDTFFSRTKYSNHKLVNNQI